MDATKLLKSQHAEVKALFGKFDHAKTAAQKQALFDQIADALAGHCTIEEKIFYPAVREIGTDKAEDMVLEALEEHHVVDLVLAELPKLDPADERFEAKMTVLSEMVEHHADEEEEEMFPMAEEELDDDLDELLEQMMERKQALKTF